MKPDGVCAADSVYCCIPRYSDRILTLNKDKMNQIVLLEIKKTSDQAKEMFTGRRNLASWTSLIKRAVHAYCQTEGDKDCSMDPTEATPADQPNWVTTISGATKVQMITHHGALSPAMPDVEWSSMTKGWPLQCQCKCPGGGVWPTSYVPNIDTHETCDYYFLQETYKFSQVTGSNFADAYEVGHEGCQCFGGKMQSEFLEWEKVVTPAGTMKTIHCGEEHSNFSEILDIMQQMSGANDIEDIFNPTVELGFEPTETDNKEVVGKFCYAFDYNPLSACRNGDVLVTGPECKRWTTHTDGCWNFSINGKWKGEPVSDATRYDDLTITMIPEYCKLIFVKPTITTKNRVCQLQADFFKRITSKIWAEKVSTQIDQIGFNHRKDLLYVWDIVHDRPVVANGVKVLENYTYCYTEDDNGLIRDADGELVLATKGEKCPTLSTDVMSRYQTQYANLAEMGPELAQIYNNAYSGVQTYISHCIRKTLTFTRLDFYCMADTGEKVDFSQMDGANTDKVSELIRAKLGDIFGDQGFEEISVGGKQRRFRVTGTTLGENGDVEGITGDGEETNSVGGADFVPVA